jgi:hypothetical protein
MGKLIGDVSMANSSSGSDRFLLLANESSGPDRKRFLQSIQVKHISMMPGYDYIVYAN